MDEKEQDKTITCSEQRRTYLFQSFPNFFTFLTNIHSYTSSSLFNSVINNYYNLSHSISSPPSTHFQSPSQSPSQKALHLYRHLFSFVKKIKEIIIHLKIEHYVHQSHPHFINYLQKKLQKIHKIPSNIELNLNLQTHKYIFFKALYIS